jgi:hypothetical protein
MANDKNRAYELIDRLPPTQLSAVVGLLESMLEPFAETVASLQTGEEELTPQTIAAIKRGQDSLDRGQEFRTKTFSVSSVWVSDRPTWPSGGHLVPWRPQ